MEKITIKEFVEKYKSYVNQTMAENYIRDNLYVKQYVPFVEKDTYAQSLAEVSSYKYEINDKGERERTDILQMNSSFYYLFMTKYIILAYTNLQTSDEFLDDYDMLRESGLLQVIMSKIPEVELKEFKMLCDMKRDDLIANYTNPQAYVGRQIDNFSKVANAVIEPLLNTIVKKIDEFDKNDIDKIIQFAKKKVK